MDKLEILKRYGTVGSYMVTKGMPRVHVYRPLMEIWYNYNYNKTSVFIATDGAVSTDTDDTYLSHLSDAYSNVYIGPVFCPSIDRLQI